jgi:hypothetical protein
MVFDRFGVQTRINQAILPGDYIGVGHRSGIILPEMPDELVDDPFEAIPGLLDGFTLTCPISDKPGNL